MIQTLHTYATQTSVVSLSGLWRVLVFPIVLICPISTLAQIAGSPERMTATPSFEATVRARAARIIHEEALARARHVPRERFLTIRSGHEQIIERHLYLLTRGCRLGCDPIRPHSSCMLKGRGRPRDCRRAPSSARDTRGHGSVARVVDR